MLWDNQPEQKIEHLTVRLYGAIIVGQVGRLFEIGTSVVFPFELGVDEPYSPAFIPRAFLGLDLLAREEKHRCAHAAVACSRVLVRVHAVHTGAVAGADDRRRYERVGGVDSISTWDSWCRST